jgi:hypothetical protein
MSGVASLPGWAVWSMKLEAVGFRRSAISFQLSALGRRRFLGRSPIAEHRLGHFQKYCAAKRHKKEAGVSPLKTSSHKQIPSAPFCGCGFI